MRKMLVRASRRSIARPDRMARRSSASLWWQRRKPRRRGLPPIRKDHTFGLFRGSQQEDSEMTERISLEAKVAVVTGAGRGLGRAYVELLAERSARVVVNDLGPNVSGFGKDSGIGEEVADLIRSRGGEAMARPAGVRR